MTQLAQAENDDYQSIPNLWGSEQAVPAQNRRSVDVADFVFTPYRKGIRPVGWDGKTLILFVMRGMEPDTIANIYVTRQQ